MSSDPVEELGRVSTYKPAPGNDDPTEARRRELLPEVNAPAAAALRAASAKIVEEAGGPDVEVTPEQMEVFRKQRDDDAKKLLRDELVVKYGKDGVFDSDQLAEHFEVSGFAAPFVVVRRKSDGKLGSLEFTHSPRLYYGFKLDKL